MDSRGQFRGIISLVLSKMNFYYLPLAKLTQILRLLEMPETAEANTILQYVYSGVTRLYEKHKEKIINHLSNEKFSTVSTESKQLLYSLMVNVHSLVMAKQQGPPVQGQYGIDVGYHSDPNLYIDQMKKYMEAIKSYPYQLINPSINPSLNPNLSGNLAPGMHSQFGMPMQMGNPYLNYPMNSSMNLPYGQFKNPPPRSLPPNSIPYGLNPYTNPSGMSSLYPAQYSQYLGQYPGSMVGGYSQTPPHSYPNMIGLQKNDLNSKVPGYSNFNQNSDVEKRHSASQGKSDHNSKNDKQKSLQKDPKQLNPPLKVPINLQPQITPTPKVDDNKTKATSATDFLPKKLPYKETKLLVEPNFDFKACPCKGYFEYETSFDCPVCNNKFHYHCLNLIPKPDEKALSDIACSHCKMKIMDPLNKVVDKIGEFYMMNLFEKTFQCNLNFKPFEAKCRQKNSKYEIQIRCLRSGDHMRNLEITWPDECQIKINGQKILDIPALQSNSSLKRRKDFSVFITQNIYSKTPHNQEGFANILQKIKLSIELKAITAEEANTKRIKNENTFALGIYFIEKLNADELFTKIMLEDKVGDKNFMKNMMKTNENQVEIDKITIRLVDPYSWDEIKTPVRGTKCTHAQCFDLKTFLSLMYSARNRTWKCPLCSKDCRKFMLDTEQLQLIKKAHQIEPVPKEVSVYKQGKVAFKIERDENYEDDEIEALPKTKKISKPKKEEK